MAVAKMKLVSIIGHMDSLNRVVQVCGDSGVFQPDDAMTFFSDPTGFLTGDVTTIHSRKAEVVLEELVKLVQTYQVDELVMGFPRNMDGTEGPRAELYRTFAGRVEEATGLKPVLWDERRTTVDAHRILFDAGKYGKKRK